MANSFRNEILCLAGSPRSLLVQEFTRITHRTLKSCCTHSCSLLQQKDRLKSAKTKKVNNLQFVLPKGVVETAFNSLCNKTW